MTKGAPQAGQRGRLFRGGPFSRCVFFLVLPVWVRWFEFTGPTGYGSVSFRRELVCGGAQRRRTRL